MKADITEEEVAEIYRNLFLCRIKYAKTGSGIIRAMKTFATAYDLLYDVRKEHGHIRYTLWYNDARVYERKV